MHVRRVRSGQLDDRQVLGSGGSVCHWSVLQYGVETEQGTDGAEQQRWSIVTGGRGPILLKHASSSLSKGSHPIELNDPLDVGEAWTVQKSVQGRSLMLGEVRGAAAAVPVCNELGEVAGVTGSGEGVPVVDESESVDPVGQVVPGVPVLLTDESVKQRGGVPEMVGAGFAFVTGHHSRERSRFVVDGADDGRCDDLNPRSAEGRSHPPGRYFVQWLLVAVLPIGAGNADAGAAERLVEANDPGREGDSDGVVGALRNVGDGRFGAGQEISFVRGSTLSGDCCPDLVDEVRGEPGPGRVGWCRVSSITACCDCGGWWDTLVRIVFRRPLPCCAGW